MNGLVNQCGMAAQAAGGGGLPSEDGVLRNNIFTSLTSGIQTVIGTPGTANAPLWEGFDGTLQPYRADTDGPPAWIGIDFGEVQAIYSFKYDPDGTRYWIDFEVQHSDDLTNWTTAFSITGATVSDASVTTPLTTPAAARYWRFYVTDRNSTGGPRAVECYFYS